MHGTIEKLQIAHAEKLFRSPETAWYGPPTLTRKGTAELHLIVACADRKTASAGEQVRLGTVKARSVEERCASWWRLLLGTAARTAARDLYVGDHWCVARGLPTLARARGFAPRLWIASAGYGLVPEEAMLASYSATFATDSPDAVAAEGDDPRQAARRWWTQLGRRRLRGERLPRTLAEIAAAASPGAAMMVVASPAYMSAMEDDLAAVAASPRRVRLMLVTSTPGPDAPSLRDYWVPTTATLRMSLGGALTSLHARVARRLIERLSPPGLNATTARQHVERLTERAPALPALLRQRSEDAEVQKFIQRGLRQDTTTSHTRLLREYRASGRACEQGRFRALFLAARHPR